MTSIGGLNRYTARRLLRCVQLVFILIVAAQLNAPFLSAHNERQNQTYDVSLHVFHEGWSAVLTPTASFSLPGYENKPYTVIRQEFPFHGLIGWPLVKAFGHERAVLRLISAAFALLSIELIFLILCEWVPPGVAAAGAMLWGWSPLVLQFGQVPMPDILCTTGMLAAFWFALKGNLPLSSGSFLFSILAKVSVIFFGLPILTALVLARNCRSAGSILKTALGWGIVPLIGLFCWTLPELLHPDDTPWTILKIAGERGSLHNLTQLHLYVFLAGCLLPYGLGWLGAGGCVLAVTGKNLSQINPAIIGSLAVAGVFYLILIIAKIPEPQYMLPPLAWLVLMAAFGLKRLGEAPLPAWRHYGLLLLAGLQTITSLVFTLDLKASHVPNFEDIEAAAHFIPASSRVIVAYPFYGASPAIWLNHNVLAARFAATVTNDLPELQKDGFDYLLLLDVTSHTENFWSGSLSKTGMHMFHPIGTQSNAANVIGFANSASPVREYCDRRFTRLYTSPHVVLYSVSAPGFPSH